ncbi:MAG TPA: 50S ribosomal protein L32 [Micromonosporaceae bacterium]|nr:50S ribosomal protein L32 [Micromonosporaceae bacterium]
MTGGLTPKGKTSRSRTRSRKAQWFKIEAPKSSACERCKSPRLSHTACPTCGFYNGREYPQAVKRG